MTISGQPFTFSRSRFSKVATLFYFRRYWPLYALSILLGIFFLTFLPGGIGIWLGIVLTLYPLTVPIRYSIVIGARAASFLSSEMSYEVTESEIIVRSAQGGVTTGQLSSIRDSLVAYNTLLLIFGKMTMLLLPLESLSEGDRNELLRRVANRGA